jgi:hypothetical protein
MSYEAKGELLIADVVFTKTMSGPAVRLKHFVFNLEHKTEHKVVSSSLFFSGQYVLNAYNHTLRKLTDDEKNSISIETRSGTQITWCSNSDVLVGKYQDFISAYSLSRGCQHPVSPYDYNETTHICTNLFVFYLETKNRSKLVKKASCILLYHSHIVYTPTEMIGIFQEREIF